MCIWGATLSSHYVAFLIQVHNKSQLIFEFFQGPKRFQLEFKIPILVRELFLPSNLVAVENETLSDVVFHCLRFPHALDQSTFLSTVTDNDLR